MTNSFNKQAQACDNTTFIQNFSKEINSLNFHKAEMIFTLHSLDQRIAGTPSDILETACQKILDHAKIRGAISGFKTANFEAVLCRIAGVKISANSGVRIGGNLDKFSSASNGQNTSETLATQALQPDQQHCYPSSDLYHSNITPLTPSVSTSISTTDIYEEEQEETGKNAPRGTRSETNIVKLFAKRTSHSATFDRSAPYGVTRTKVNQASINALPDPYAVTRWRDLSEDQQFALTCTHAHEKNGLFFRISFSDDMLKRFAGSGKTAVSILTEKLSDAFKSCFGQDFAFAFKFEASKSERLHVHGVLILDHDSLSVTQASLLRRALCKAGGIPANDNGAHVRDIYDGLGIYGYLKKAEKLTRPHIASGNLSHINNLMRTAIKAIHEERRYTKRAKPANENEISLITALAA